MVASRCSGADDSVEDIRDLDLLWLVPAQLVETDSLMLMVE